MRPELIILIGNIGSGKSTYCKKYQEQGCVIIARDQLRYGIGNGKYVFNYDYEPIIWDVEHHMFRRFLDLGVDIVIDEVGISKKMRERYIPYAKALGYKIIALELPRFSMEEAVARRMTNPHGQDDANLWKQVWTKFDNQYEAPTKEEGFDEIIRLEKETVR
jgi:predicted kinase